MVYGCLKEEWRDVMFSRRSEQTGTKIACLMHSKLPFSFLFPNQPRLRAGQSTDTLVKHLEALENKEAAAVRCRWQCMGPAYVSFYGRSVPPDSCATMQARARYYATLSSIKNQDPSPGQHRPRNHTMYARGVRRNPPPTVE